MYIKEKIFNFYIQVSREQKIILLKQTFSIVVFKIIKQYLINKKDFNYKKDFVSCLFLVILSLLNDILIPLIKLFFNSVHS